MVIKEKVSKIYITLPSDYPVTLSILTTLYINSLFITIFMYSTLLILLLFYMFF